MPKLTDRELVDRARDGDADAFGQLVRRHQQRIHRLAIHMLRDRAEAEDVMQETFVRAYRALDRFDGRSEPYTWLYRIAMNLSLNALRSRKSHRTSTQADDPRLEALVAEKRSTDDPPEDAQRRQLYAALTEGIDGLSRRSGAPSFWCASTAARTKRPRPSSGLPRGRSPGASTRHAAS